MIQNNLDFILSFVMCRFILTSLRSNHLVVSMWKLRPCVHRMKRSDKAYCSGPVDYLAADLGKHSFLTQESVCARNLACLWPRWQEVLFFNCLSTMCAVVETIPKITLDLLVLFRESGISIKKKGYNCFIELNAPD